MSINTKPIETGERFRSPSKFDKYADPWDNLAYALLYSAMNDLKEPRYKQSAVEWLDNEGREIYEYLKDRPLKSLSENQLQMRRRYTAKKRSEKSGKYFFL